MLIGEVYLPSARWQPYLESLDAAFAFELLHSEWDAARLRAAIEATTRRPGAAWVLSNHDFGRLVTRFGPENARSAALLLLTLPGPAFLYQGDEIGLADGPGGERVYDRAGRDRFRHPMQWDGSPSGGFTTGEAWLPPVDPERHERRGAARRPGIDALARARPARRAARARRGIRAARRRSGRGGVPARRAHDRRERDARGAAGAGRPASVVLETRPGALDAGVLAPSSAAMTMGI